MTCCDFPAPHSHPPPVINSDSLGKQRAQSEAEFGPGLRTIAIAAQIRRELLEIISDPLELDSWVEVILLAFDGAGRSGYSAKDILLMVQEKQTANVRA